MTKRTKKPEVTPEMGTAFSDIPPHSVLQYYTTHYFYSLYLNRCFKKIFCRYLVQPFCSLRKYSIKESFSKINNSNKIEEKFEFTPYFLIISLINKENKPNKIVPFYVYVIKK